MMWHLLSQKPHRFLVFILLVFADARAFVALRLLMSNLLHVSISFVIGRAVVKQVLMFCADGYLNASIQICIPILVRICISIPLILQRKY